MRLESMDVQGLKELDAALKEIGVKAGQKAMVSALRSAAKPVLEEAKSNAPVESGELENTIKIRSKKGKGQSKTLATVKVGATKKHSQKVIAAEYGTQKQKAIPFLRPALEKHWQQAVTIFKNILKKRIDSAAKRQAKVKK